MFYNNISMSDPICIDCAGGGIINCGSINNFKYFYINDATIVFVQNYNELTTNVDNHVILYGFIDIKTGHSIVSSLFFPLVISSSSYQLFIREIQTNITLNGETNITFYPYYIPRTGGNDTELGTLDNIGNIIAGKIQFAAKGDTIYNNATNLNQNYLDSTSKLFYYLEDAYKYNSGEYGKLTTGLLVPLYVIRTQGAGEIKFTQSNLVFKIEEVEFNIKQRQTNRYNTST